MNHSVQDRERAVQAITRRNMLEQRIKRTQGRMATLHGEARQALEASLLADQAALSEAIQTMEQIKVDMRREEERRRWELQEKLRYYEDLKSRQSPFFSSGNVPSSPGQTLGFLVVLVVIVAIVGIVLLLNG